MLVFVIYKGCSLLKANAGVFSWENRIFNDEMSESMYGIIRERRQYSLSLYDNDSTPSIGNVNFGLANV